jgi:hypothetical protein
MHSVRSGTDTNTLYLTLSDDVTVANLARFERTALVAARVLEADFVLVTDVGACTSITVSAVERINEVIDQLVQFGLDREVRLIKETTPEAVRERFEMVDGERDVDVDVLHATDELSPAAITKASS